MKNLSVGDTAPEFSLPDHEGRLFSLARLLEVQHVLLVFNLGFI
jgi:peroxiredoxin